MLTEGTYLIYDPNRGSNDKVITARTNSDHSATVDLDEPEHFNMMVREQRWHITPDRDARDDEVACTIKNSGTNKFLAYKERGLSPLDPILLVDRPCYWTFTYKGDDTYLIRPMDEYGFGNFILATRFGTVEIAVDEDDPRETTLWKLKTIDDRDETNDLYSL